MTASDAVKFLQLVTDYQKFPKGRLDNLITHLFRRCLGLTEDDRRWLRSTTGQSPDLSQHEPSALIPLAEVSRRDQNTLSQAQHDAIHLEERVLHEADVAFLPRKDAAQDHVSDDLPDQDVSSVTSAHHSPLMDSKPVKLVAYSIPMDRDSPPSKLWKTASSGDHFLPTAAPAEVLVARKRMPLTETTAVSDTPHLEIVNDEAQASRDETSTLECLPNDVPTERQQRISNSTVPMACIPANVSRVTGFVSLTTTLDMSSGLGSLQASAKISKRGKFTDDRRREVSELRKQGACIRCRMLKKPCSGGTPCNTCASVSSARLWKAKCIRTRLAEEFTLWACGLYHSRAQTRLSDATHGLREVAQGGRIEVRLCSRSKHCMSFAARKYSSPLVHYESSVTDHRSVREDDDGPNLGNEEDVWTISESEEFLDKIEPYISLIADRYVAEDRNDFMRTTLQTAQEHIRSDRAKGSLESEANGTRACYNLQGGLLSNVVNLWVCTSLLVFHDKTRSSLTYNPTKVPATKPDVAGTLPNGTFALAAQLGLAGRSADLIFAQVLAAIESRCQVLGKIVMNELEKRLLQRQQASRFATFLASVIFLNCVERMTGAYRTLDEESEDTEMINPTPDGDTTQARAASPDLWREGEHFSDLLIMLLRMRALPPKTTATEDGRLVVDRSQALSVVSNYKPTKEQANEHDRVAASWLDPLNMRDEDLVHTRDSGLPGLDAGVAAWDLKFISRVLMPERTTST